MTNHIKAQTKLGVKILLLMFLADHLPPTLAPPCSNDTIFCHHFSVQSFRICFTSFLPSFGSCIKPLQVLLIENSHFKAYNRKYLIYYTVFLHKNCHKVFYSNLMITNSSINRTQKLQVSKVKVVGNKSYEIYFHNLFI